MAKKESYRCSECGWLSAKWQGQCRQCQAWGTLAEVGASAGLAKTAVRTPIQAAQPISQVSAESAQARPSGVGELDRVLGGGIVPGAVILLAGEPGVGKSTLLLTVAANAARQAKLTGAGSVLYITGEESASQVRLRAARIDALADNLLLAAETELGAVLGQDEKGNPSLLFLDSGSHPA